MATKAMTKTETGNTDLARWETELARQAAEAAGQEASTGGGQFFSLRGGLLTLDGATLPDNQMAVVVLDSLLENVYYPEAFDPDDPQIPACYAFGRDEKTMGPHADAADPQAAGCAACEHNQWGSAARRDGSKGRGKACRNRRRLALIPAGTLQGKVFTPVTTPEEITTGPLRYLALPPTSIAGFATYVKQLAGALSRPPRAVFTRVAVVPDPKTQIKVTFTVLGPVPAALLDVVMARAKEAAAVIEFSYQQANPEQPRGRDDSKAKPSNGKKRKY